METACLDGTFLFFDEDTNMTGSRISSADLDERRSRILFRAWRRGTREMDFLVGRFADTILPEISDADLADFEQLIEVPDADLFGWATGATAVPENYDTPVFRRMRVFNRDNPVAGAL
jgi:antitoxin CptB